MKSSLYLNSITNEYRKRESRREYEIIRVLLEESVLTSACILLLRSYRSTTEIHVVAVCCIEFTFFYEFILAI